MKCVFCGMEKDEVMIKVTHLGEGAMEGEVIHGSCLAEYTNNRGMVTEGVHYKVEVINQGEK